MEQYDNLVNNIALSMGASWASGINLYAAILTLGIMANSGSIILPEEMEFLQNPFVLLAAGLMYGIEFFADKIPGVDSLWDALHSFIRIPAGAILAAGAVGDVSAPVEFAAYLVGGSVAGASYAFKAGSRVLINTSPEPVTNWSASIAEDIAVIGGIWAALHHPWIFLALFVLFIILLVWLLPKIWSGIKIIAKKIAKFFGGGKNNQ